MKSSVLLASLAASLGMASTGLMTSYVNDGAVGACNDTLVAGTNYVAVPPSDVPSMCGFNVTIVYNGISATGTVQDSCETCKVGQIEVSKYMFKTLTGFSYGSKKITFNTAKV